jgi:inner membrane protein
VPTVLSHAVFAAVLYVPFRRHLPPGVAVAGALAAVVPDLDVVSFSFGIAYGDLLGHRGLTHSVAFAAAFGALCVLALSRSLPSRARLPAFIYLALATASHGLFDALTNGGLGVAFLAPFSNERIFFPWQPIEVSPLGITGMLSSRGLDVLRSEVIWVGLPSLAIALLGILFTRRSGSSIVAAESRA